ncbi:putative metabolite transport protein [Colletotrichum shisoi]|uniref:Putative metabolite transport protein n=1 Tax=Colletotrichum shisoi TaxID=2078593 RepID=A0A5Q4BWJ4_9PEZI|nr:putative metabolite transport protein [Colletotrichum shisoi]
MSYQLQIAQPVLSIVGNLMAAAVIDRVGRRNLAFYGLGILTAFLLITGGLGTGTTQLMIKGTVAFILVYSWWYNTGGRSYEELDEMFQGGVPARKLKTYKSTMQMRNEAAAQGVGH